MTKFEEEFNYLIELSGKVLIGQVDAEAFEKNRIAFFEKYETVQQQALPVVPSFVAEWIEYWKSSGRGLVSIHRALTEGLNLPDFDKVHAWLSEYEKKYEKNGEEIFEDMNGVEPPNATLFIRAWLDGYTVEKPQLFYLKNKLTESYLYYDEATKLYSDIVGNVEDFFGTKTKFTQQEIDSMQTGSYEQIEVAE